MRLLPAPQRPARQCAPHRPLRAPVPRHPGGRRACRRAPAGIPRRTTPCCATPAAPAPTPARAQPVRLDAQCRALRQEGAHLGAEARRGAHRRAQPLRPPAMACGLVFGISVEQVLDQAVLLAAGQQLRRLLPCRDRARTHEPVRERRHRPRQRSRRRPVDRERQAVAQGRHPREGVSTTSASGSMPAATSACTRATSAVVLPLPVRPPRRRRRPRAAPPRRAAARPAGARRPGHPRNP